MKKYIVFLGLLAILLIPALLAGCGGGVSTTTTPPASTATSPTATTTSPSGTTTSPTNTTTTPITTTTTETGNLLNQILSQTTNYPTVYFEMKVTVTGLKEETTIKYWIKNYKKFRIEQVSTGLVIFINMEAQTMYMYYPDKKMVMKMAYDTKQAPESPSTVLAYSPKVVGTETKDGKECTVIEYTYQGESVKEWIWNDNGFPVRMVSEVSGVTTTIEWKNYDFSDIDDSIFKLPEDVQIIG
jgi:hypothetical protein